MGLLKPPLYSYRKSSGESPSRSVGRLFAVPRLTCDCGSRVLELLYCQACGEVYLGGFTPELSEGPQGYLFPSDTETPSGQPLLVSHRTHERYVWYWPGKLQPGQIEKWTHKTPDSLGPGLSNNTGTFQLAPAKSRPQDWSPYTRTESWGRYRHHDARIRHPRLAKEPTRLPCRNAVRNARGRTPIGTRASSTLEWFAHLSGGAGQGLHESVRS